MANAEHLGEPLETRLRSLSYRRRPLAGSASRRAAAFGACATGVTGGSWGSGWMGGYGGVWMPILVVAVVVGVAVMVIRRK
jgi:hypothetical protein